MFLLMALWYPIDKPTLHPPHMGIPNFKIWVAESVIWLIQSIFLTQNPPTWIPSFGRQVASLVCKILIFSAKPHPNKEFRSISSQISIIFTSGFQILYFLFLGGVMYLHFFSIDPVPRSMGDIEKSKHKVITTSCKKYLLPTMFAIYFTFVPSNLSLRKGQLKSQIIPSIFQKNTAKKKRQRHWENLDILTRQVFSKIEIALRNMDKILKH